MDIAVDILISGLRTGAIYALIALGFVIIYKSSGIMNIAHGYIMLLLAAVAWSAASEWQLPLWGVLLVIIVCGVIVGTIIEEVAIRPLIGQPLLSVIMVTIALGLVIEGIVMTNWASAVYYFPLLVGSGSITLLGDLSLARVTIFTIIACGITVLAISLFVLRTKQGLAMRGAAEGHQICRSLGIRIPFIFRLTWAIACVTAGIAGLALGLISGVSGGMIHLGLKAIPVAILGGLESLLGAIIAGVAVGLLEVVACRFLDPLLPAGGVAGVFPFVVMVFVLIFKPYGLFGLEKVERV